MPIRSSGPLVDDLRLLEPKPVDQGIPGARHTKRPEQCPGRRGRRGVDSRSGVYPIFVSGGVVRLSADPSLAPWRAGGVVETRRLELLTLSLQRRCSSD